MGMTSSYVAIVVSYRDPTLVERVLSQLSAQSCLPTKVIVVDNAGDLRVTPVALDALPFELTVLRRPENPGYSAAVNAVRPFIGTGERVLVLTHDAQFSPNLASSLLDVMDSSELVGAVGPVLMSNSAPTRPWSYGGRLTRGGRAWHVTDRPRGSRVQFDVDWIDGAIVLLNGDALNDVGWLDERYFLYYEDVDTGWRLRRAGWRVIVTRAVTASQEPGSHSIYLGVRNMTLFSRHAGISAARATAAIASRVFRESAYEILHGRPPHPLAAWRGWLDGRRGLDGNPARTGYRTGR